MKDLQDDKRNCMLTELVAVELKIRLNASLSCTEAYDFFLSKPELLKLIQMRNIVLKNNVLINIELSAYFMICYSLS